MSCSPARKAANPSGSNSRPSRQEQGGHHLVADDRVGHGVDRGQHHVGVALEDLLDRGGGEVLAVDPQPVVVPAPEVEEVVLVPVGEVPGPVPAVAHPGRLGLGVAPVALEPGRPGGVDHLADGLLGVEQPSLGVEHRPRALLAGVGIDDHGSRAGPGRAPRGACPACAAPRHPPRWSRRRRGRRSRTAPRTGPRRPRPPRCRTPAATGCRHRRAARGCPGCRRAACPRS